ncbi:hypothetical protein [Thalassospira sp.]|uniref:hypothetical protein n=1 Tax=Thalassospira sp. TaxID=1912094 RepID=UPI002733BFB4|nr:hypothetical protein [Thalassospira sp.]MDP2698642.1 hypothetical protein [Thalassospira sp.]
MHRFVIAFCALMLIGLTSLRVQGAELRLCYDRWAPYAYDDGAGATGLAVELTQMALNEAGHHAEFFQMPRARCYFGIRYGIFDGILLDHGDDYDALKLLVADRSVVSRVLVALVREDFRHGASRAMDMFAGANWLKVAGHDYPVSLTENQDMIPVDVAENAHGIEMLQKRHVDVVFRDLASLHFGRDPMVSPAGIRIVMPAISIDQQFLRLIPSLGGVMTDYNRAMETLSQTGMIDRIYYKHLGFSQIGFQRYISRSSTPVTSALMEKIHPATKAY